VAYSAVGGVEVLEIGELGAGSLAAIQPASASPRWNPRAGDVFAITHARQGIAVSGTPLPELLEAATENGVSFELRARMVPLLIDADLIQADRGSVTNEGRLRRSPKHVVDSIVGAGTRGIALLTEVRQALVEQRPPRQIDADGQPVEHQEADRTWLDNDSQFRTRPGRRPDPEPQPEPEPEPETDHSLFAQAYDALLDMLGGVRDGLETARGQLDILTEIKARAPEVGLDEDQRSGLGAQLEELSDIGDTMFEPIRQLRARRAP
jgi:hypothetical protein